MCGHTKQAGRNPKVENWREICGIFRSKESLRLYFCEQKLGKELSTDEVILPKAGNINA
jgi:hypothetical protein